MIELTLPPKVNLILKKLENAGFEAFAVGGCVRDLLRNVNPHDWDIATSAHPEQIHSCFPEYTAIDVGAAFGTTNIIIENESFEVTTFRIEGDYSDNRHPNEVKFTDNIIDDLKRRDFTINAMAYNQQRGLIDPFDGQDDLTHRLIRCVAQPKKRFSEDALRIMRALRFAAVFNYDIEPETAVALRKLAANLTYISPERIACELNKLLCSPKPSKILSQFRDVIAVFIPEIVPSFDFDQANPHHCYDVWNHILHGIDAAPRTKTLRLAMLFHDIGKPFCQKYDEEGIGHFFGHAIKSAEIVEIALNRLRYENETIKNVTELIKHHADIIVNDEKSIKRWLNRIGEKQFRRLIELRKADIKAQNPDFAPERLEILTQTYILLGKILAEQQCFRLKDLKINGNDLLKIGFQPGPVLGKCLQKLLEEVIEERLRNEPQVLKEAAENYLLHE